MCSQKESLVQPLIRRGSINVLTFQNNEQKQHALERLTHIFSLRLSNVWKMLYSSIFLKLVFCQKKSSVVNFRKVKSIYKSKHKHGAMKTRRMWGPAGSRSAEVTVGAGLAGKRVGTSFPSLNTGQRGGRVWRRYEAQRALSPLRCHSPPHPSSRRQWTLSVYVCSLLLGFRED